MTTAHRPTYNPSRGKDTIFANPSLQFSSRDLPSNTTIKYRNDNVGKVEEMKKELLKRERESKVEDDIDDTDLNIPNKKRKLIEETSNKKNEEDSFVNVFIQDKDVEYNDDKEEDNDSVDTEEELLIELEKIKKAQLEEKIKKENEMKEKTQQEILKANPLLNQSFDTSSINGEYSLKKKWYEDTVFKNQTKLEQKVKKRFINDTVRSDFHRKFLSKTVQ